LPLVSGSLFCLMCLNRFFVFSLFQVT
jgi:hypothetical protein